MNVTLARVLCSSSTFMGHLHFCSGDIPFLIQTPPLRMTGFQIGGGGGASDFFFKEAHKILTLRTNFSKVPTCKERTRRISFFKERRQKFEASISSHPSGSGGCPVTIKYGLSPRAIFPTPISHSITLSQNLTNWCDLYWRKIIVSTMISWFLTKSGTKFRLSEDVRNDIIHVHYIKGDRLVYLPHLQLPSSRWASSSLALHVQQRFRFFCVDISFPRTSFLDPFSCLLVSKSRELFPWAACSVSVFLHFESFVSPWTSRLTSCSLEITFPRSCFDSFRPEVCSLGIVDGTEALFSSTFSFLCNSRKRGEMHSKKWKTAVR